MAVPREGGENGTMRLEERSNRFTRSRCPHLQTVGRDAFEDDGMSVTIENLFEPESGSW